MTATASASPRPNRMAKRRLRTRQQLIEATEALVLAQGYAQASAEAIAELADLGRSTFYNHFDNKQEAVLATLIAHYHDYGDAAYVPLESTRDRAESVVRSTIRVFTAMAADPLTQQLVDKPLLLARAIAESQGEFAGRDFAEGIAQGRFTVNVSQDSLLTALNWSYTGLLIHAINQQSSAATSLDWARLLLAQLGIAPDEIDTVVTAALQN